MVASLGLLHPTRKDLIVFCVLKSIGNHFPFIANAVQEFGIWSVIIAQRIYFLSIAAAAVIHTAMAV